MESPFSSRPASSSLGVNGEINTHDETRSMFGAPVDLLRKIILVGLVCAIVAFALQVPFVIREWITQAPNFQDRAVVFLMTGLFTLTLVNALGMARNKRAASAVILIFCVVCVTSVVIAIFQPTLFGICMLGPMMALLACMPYVDRTTFSRLSVASGIVAAAVALVFALSGQAAIPTLSSFDMIVRVAPLLAVPMIALALLWALYRWLNTALNDLRTARSELAARIDERTHELSDTNSQLQAEIRERRAAEAQLRRQAAYLTALNETAVGLVNRFDTNELLQAMVTRAAEMLDTPHIYLSLLSADGSTLDLAYSSGIFEPVDETSLVFHRSTGYGMVGHVLFSGEPFIVDDYASWPERLTDVDTALHACLVVPLKTRDQVIGVLGVGYTDPTWTFDADKRELLTRFAQLGSIVYDNARLYESARVSQRELNHLVVERTREISALLSVSQKLTSAMETKPFIEFILNQFKPVVEHDSAAVFVAAEGERLRMLYYKGPPQTGIGENTIWPLTNHHRQVFETGKPAIISDVTADTPEANSFRQLARGQFHDEPPAHILSWMGVPLRLKDQVTGILTFDRAERNYYTPRHAELAEGIAQQVALALENARLQRQALDAVAQAERTRLARELHDSVSQAIYGIVLAARTMEHLIDKDPTRLQMPLQHVISLSDAAMTEMRALIFELRPESLIAEGLIMALSKQAAAIRARNGINVMLEIGHDDPPLSDECIEALYRVALESIHNVVKHSGATTVHVRMAQVDGSVELEVKDNGRGFDPANVPPGHLGLQSMRERIAACGGHIDIASAPGKGTHVKIDLPALKAAALVAAGELPVRKLEGSNV